MTGRLLALAAAVVMIGGAVLVRAQLDGDDGSPGSRPDAGSPATLACDPSLAAVCRALADAQEDLVVVVEPAAETRSRLESPAARPDEVGVDGWLTLDPLPAIVAEQRERAGHRPLLGEASGPLARSPLALVAWTDRLAVLDEACGSEVGWACIGDHAGAEWTEAGGPSRWGRLGPGLDDRAADATALLVAGQIAADHFGGTTFASNDFDPAFRAWWADLWDAVPSFTATRGTVLDQMLAAGPASYDLVGTTEAAAVTAVRGSRESGNVTISYPAPMVTADVVLVPVLDAPGAGRIAALVDGGDLGPLLADAGWRVADHPPADGLDPALALPDATGLPRPGVLEALRRL